MYQLRRMFSIDIQLEHWKVDVNREADIEWSPEFAQ